MNIKKKGQVTLFIIMGILIISVILVFILLIKPKFIDSPSARLGLEGCIEDSLEKSIKELSNKAGFVNPELTYSYLGEKITYLCYTEEYYKTCTIQKPFLKQHFEEQIKEDIKDEVKNCYDNSVSELKSRGLDIKEGTVDFDVFIIPGQVNITINAPTTIGSNNFKKFYVKLNSEIYETLMVATSILQYETKLGDSDTTSLMVLYPNLIIDKLKQSDGTTIYIIENKIYKNKFKFASRSLAWPAGYDV